MAVLQTDRSGKETATSSDGLLAKLITLRELIDARAKASADASYLISPETRRAVSYRGLQGQARALAARLQGLGLSAGDNVAFLMDNGLFAAELFLGVMYGGFVSVPLNVRAGVSQLAYMVEHCDAKVVFVAAEYAALMSEILAQVRRPVQVIPADVDEVSAVDGTTVPEPPRAVPGAEDTALLMYTSGSTGHPKAAVHTHRTLLAHGRNSVCSHQLTAADRSLLVLPLYHINAECVTLIPTLLSGGSVVIPHKFSISHYWDWLDDYRCTWSAIVPAIVSQLLDWQDPRADQRGPAFGRIRFLRSSSAPLAPSLHREFLQKFPLLLIQAMGSSEGGNIFSNPLPPGENKIGSPGLPWGFEVRVVDHEGQEVPEGQPGEMLIRGEGLAHSYYKEPEATAAAFDAEGWWHTGDLAYRDADGYFFVVGRSKELIIKGGVNIAPRQIDDVLESHPAVLEAAAVGVPDRLLGEDVVAFAVLRAGASCDEWELLTFCEGRLGHFKTPTRIQFVEDLPKGPSGKVQRLRLVEEATRTQAAARVPQGFALGRGSDRVEEAATLPPSLEATIGAIWADLLKLPEVGEHDNFFALGGDSLLAIQCVSRLRDKVAVRLTLTDFFANGTVAELAALVKERFEAARCVEEVEKALGQGSFQPPRAAGSEPIPVRDRKLPYQLSPLQQRLWFMEQLNPDLPVYNEWDAVRLHGELNVAALEKALNGVVARHESLRTTIRVMDGLPMGVVLDSYSLRVKQIDLTELPATQRLAESQRLLNTESRIPYHLPEEPPIRATLIRLAPDDHVFIVMMHHIICDWSSLGVLWRDFSALYRSSCRNESLSLPPLAIQHGDFAVWERQQLTESAVAAGLDFWVENLRGAPPLLELPSDRPRPQEMSYLGARKRFRFSSELTEACRNLSRQERRSLFALFTAALNVLLHRYTGQEDILLGIPVADRSRPELQSMIGFLLQTHVLRTKVEADLTFRELVSRVQRAALELYEHRSVPFERVVQALRPHRNASYSPLFQVMVIWRDCEQLLSCTGLEDLCIESLMADTGTSKFDLTLFLTDMGDEIWAEIEYSTDLFDEATIVRMFEHYWTLMEAVVTDPEKCVRELPLVSEEVRAETVERWNDTRVPYPECAIHELFEAQAQRTPSAVAVEFGRSKLTYRELNARANRLAHDLRTLAVGPGTLVGIATTRSLEMVVGLLAVLKAGAAYVPLDPAYPRERLAFILEETQVPLVLTQRSIAALLPAGRAQIVCLDDRHLEVESHEPSGSDGRFSDEPLDPSFLAYVLYTSGSTGKPKGVGIGHRAVVSFLTSMQREPGISPQDILLSVTTLAFDIAGLELWLPLTTGAKVVIAAEEATRDGRALATLLKRSGATVMQATPSTWLLLLDSGWEGKSDLKILCGGEAWPAALAERLLPKCASLWNMYGPTETTIWSAVKKVESGSAITIGRPIANTQFHVVDAHLRALPVGIPGELLIGGAGLAQGYWQRPELTAEKFISNPFSADPGSRLYRTGDRVRYLADGALEFFGRMDYQVKIRGFRIELGEIENSLRAHPAVRDAAVVVGNDPTMGKQLIAYLVYSDGPRATTADLRDLLKAKLPAYMVPAVWVELAALPLTPNGKLDRKALPAPSRETVAPATLKDRSSSGLPRDMLEVQLTQLWERVLGVRPIGRNDDFFDLGGHSFLAVRLFAGIEKLTGKRLPLATVFHASTIAALAEILRHEGWTPNWSSLVPIQPGGSQAPLFLVHGAEGNVLLYRQLARYLGPDQPVYGFQSQGLSGEQSAFLTRIEEMATRYVEELVTLRPDGPYYLGGYCLGGVLAYEMAQQLRAMGREVGLVLLLETYNLNTVSSSQLRGRKPVHTLQKVWFHAANLRLAEGHDRWKFLREKCEVAVARLEVQGRALYQGLSASSADGTRHRYPHLLVKRINDEAVLQYVPRPYAGRVALIRPKANFRGFDDPTFGWGGLVGSGLSTHEVPIYPRGMLVEPFVQTLAEQVRSALAQAR